MPIQATEVPRLTHVTQLIFASRTILQLYTGNHAEGDWLAGRTVCNDVSLWQAPVWLHQACLAVLSFPCLIIFACTGQKFYPDILYSWQMSGSTVGDLMQTIFDLVLTRLPSTFHHFAALLFLLSHRGCDSERLAGTFFFFFVKDRSFWFPSPLPQTRLPCQRRGCRSQADGEALGKGHFGH